MSSPKLGSYLRTYRLRAGLTQRDVAALLGLETGSTISRTEKGNGIPSIQLLLGYCVLFDVHPKELVPRNLRDMEKEVLARANILAGQLKKRRATPIVLERLKFLEKLSQLMGRQLPKEV